MRLLALALALSAPAWASTPAHAHTHTQRQARARVLRLGYPLLAEAVEAPGTVSYVLEAFKNVAGAEECEVRVSHLAIPPVSFSFSVVDYPKPGRTLGGGDGGGSAASDENDAAQDEGDDEDSGDDGVHALAVENATQPMISESSWLRKRRRRLDTSIFKLPLGKRGRIIVDNGREVDRALLLVTVKPAGVTSFGVEDSVAVTFNILVELKLFNNSLPESGVRIAFVGVLCLLGSALILVPALSKLLTRGDDLVHGLDLKPKEARR